MDPTYGITDSHNFQEALKRKVLKGKHSKTIDSEFTTPASWLLEKKKEIAEVQSALEAQKDEYEVRQSVLKQRDETLQHRGHSLQESFLKFNRFLLDNDTKRAKAERRIVEEKGQQEIKEVELGSMMEVLRKLEIDREEKSKLLESMTMYQKYLQTVVESTEEFKEVKTLIERWGTLQQTTQQLQKTTAQHLQDTETARVSLLRYSEEKTNEILDLDNKIAKLQQTLESIQEKVRLGQAENDETSESAVEKCLQIGQIRMAIDNIFRQVVEHGNYVVRKTDTLQQLQYITNSLIDLQDILDSYNNTSLKPIKRPSQP
eukprot:TRINITY_DN1995_c0_g1_i2.p1 TRINITY_DN1995_c0_g1~~TRINITY_DN1995_c0_g1_i2.p1  ORF type:complete len:317 (-),score=64.19 TRINITY_DN1995_c0_g1_i2:129-1079(-)